MHIESIAALHIARPTFYPAQPAIAAGSRADEGAGRNRHGFSLHVLRGRNGGRRAVPPRKLDATLLLCRFGYELCCLLSFLLSGKLLPDFGGDGVGVDLIGAGGLLENGTRIPTSGSQQDARLHQQPGESLHPHGERVSGESRPSLAVTHATFYMTCVTT